MEKQSSFGYWESLGRNVISHCSFFRPQAKKTRVFVIFLGSVANTEFIYKFHVALHAFYAAIPNIDFKISSQVHLSHLYQNSTIMKQIEHRI
jgi:hypothetical protein